MRQVVLNFHGIGTPGRALEPGEAPYWITPDQFEATLQQVLARRQAVTVAFTFDDGNRSDLTIGAEALARHGLRGTFFVLAGRLGQPGSLAADDLRALRRMGHAIGSHGADHVAWTGLDAAGEERELVWAREALAAAAGAPVEAAAIPFGRYDRRVLAALRRLGYARVFSSDGGPARPGQFPIPRTSLRADTTPARIEALLSGREPLHRRLRRRLAIAVKKRL